MAIAAPDWALGRVVEAGPDIGEPEIWGPINCFCDKGLRKNELRSIAESLGWLRFSIGVILRHFGIEGPAPNPVLGTDVD